MIGVHASCDVVDGQTLWRGDDVWMPEVPIPPCVLTNHVQAVQLVEHLDQAVVAAFFIVDGLQSLFTARANCPVEKVQLVFWDADTLV